MVITVLYSGWQHFSSLEEFRWSLLLFFILMMFMVWVGVMLIKGSFEKMIIDKDRIVWVKTSGREELLLNDIIKIESIKSGIHLISKSRNEPYYITNSLQHYGEIYKWLHRRYPNEQHIKQELERQELLNDRRLGSHVAERRQSLWNTQMQVIIYYVVGFLLFLLLVFRPEPYDLLMLTAFIYPFVGLVIVALNRRLTSIVESENTQILSVKFGVYCAASAIAIRAFLDNYFYEYLYLCLLVIFVATLFCVVFFLVQWLMDRDARFKTIIFDYCLSGLLYAYGIVGYINCEYDKSTPSVFFGRDHR